MILLVVRSELLDEAASRLLQGYPELGDCMKLVEYSQFLTRSSWPAGTYLFSSACELPIEAKRILALVEECLLEGGCRLMNRPSHARPRNEILLDEAGSIGAWPLTELNVQAPRFPLVLRGELPGSTLQIPPLYGTQDLEDAAASMVMSGCDPRRIVALEHSDVPVQSVLVLGSHRIPETPGLEALSRFGLDAAWVEYRVEEGKVRLWRVDDSPLALLPAFAKGSADRESVAQILLDLEAGIEGEVTVEIAGERLASAMQMY